MATVSTGTLSINAAFLQEIKEDNRLLRDLLERAFGLCNDPRFIRIQPRRLVELFRELQDQLAMHDRRKSQRAPLLVQVEIKDTQEFSIGRVENISEGGLLVLSHNTLELKKEVITRFNLPPPGRHIECVGVVVRIQYGSIMAIEFQQLKEEDRKAIAEFVKASLEGCKFGTDYAEQPGGWQSASNFPVHTRTVRLKLHRKDLTGRGGQRRFASLVEN